MVRIAGVITGFLLMATGFLAWIVLPILAWVLKSGWPLVPLIGSYVPIVGGYLLVMASAGE